MLGWFPKTKDFSKDTVSCFWYITIIWCHLLYRKFCYSCFKVSNESHGLQDQSHLVTYLAIFFLLSDPTIFIYLVWCLLFKIKLSSLARLIFHCPLNLPPLITNPAVPSCQMSALVSPYLLLPSPFKWISFKLSLSFRRLLSLNSWSLYYAFFDSFNQDISKKLFFLYIQVHGMD